MRKFTHVSILIITALTVSIVNNPGPGYIAWAGDTIFPIDFSIYIKKLENPWLNVGDGLPNLNYPYAVVYKLFHLLNFIGINKILIFYLAFLILTSISTYISANLLIKDKNASFLISLIYTYNSITLYVFEYTWIFSTFFYLYIALPLILSSTIKILEKKEFKYYYILAIGCFLASFSYGNFVYLLTTSILVNLITFQYFIVNSNKLENFFNILKLNLILFSVGFWAYIGTLPEIYYLAKQVNPSPHIGSLSTWILGQSLDLKSTISLNPILNRVHTSHMYLLLVLIWVIVSYYPIIFIKKIKSYKIIIYILGITFCLFAFLTNKGRGWLSDEIILFIFTSNPLFAAFRSVEKSIIALYSILICIYCLLYVNKIINKKYLLSIALLNIVISYPFFLGGIQEKYSVAKDSGKNFSYLVKTPSGLQNTISFMNKNIGEESCYLNYPFTAWNSIGWSTLSGETNAVGVDPVLFATYSRAYNINSIDFIKSLDDIKFKNDCEYILENNDGYVLKNLNYKKIILEAQKENVLTKIYEDGNYSLYKKNDYQNNFITACKLILENTNEDKPICTYPNFKIIDSNLIRIYGENLDNSILLIKKGYRPSWSLSLFDENKNKLKVNSNIKKGMNNILEITVGESESKIEYIDLKYDFLINWKIMFYFTLLILICLFPLYFISGKKLKLRSSR